MINHRITEELNKSISVNNDKAITACVLCSHNCGLEVKIEDSLITEIKADQEHPVTGGYICNKGRRIDFYQTHKQRLTSPLKKKADGSFEEISWPQAIKEIGARLKQIKKEHSANAIALAGVGGQANHSEGIFALNFLRGMGGYKWFNSWAQEKTQHHLVDELMFKAPPQSFMLPDKKKTQYLMIFGSNPLLSNRGTNAPKYIKAFRGDDRKLVVVDPIETETTAKADQHLQLKPSTDCYLLLGMLKVIVSEKLYDLSFVEKHTTGFDRIKEQMSEVNLDDMAERCGIATDVIITVSREFATAPTASFMYDLGVEQIKHLTLVSYLFRVIGSITGNIGKDGTNVFVTGMTPDLKIPLSKKQKMLASGIQGVPALGPFPMFSTTLLTEEIEVDHPHRVRALVVSAHNPMVSNADSLNVERSLKKLDLLVVIDISETETTLLADYVLPAPSGYEKYEYSSFPNTYPEIYSHVRHPIIKGAPGTLPEAEIFTSLAEEAGFVKEPPTYLKALGKNARKGPLAGSSFFAALWARAAAAGGSVDAIVARTIFWTYRCVGPTLPTDNLAGLWWYTQMYALSERAAIRRAYPQFGPLTMPYTLGEFIFNQLLENPRGALVGLRDTTKNLQEFVRRSKIQLMPKKLEYTFNAALGDDFAESKEFPFIVNTGRRTKWNANTIQRNPEWRKKPLLKHGAAYINPLDAEKSGIEEGDLIRISSTRAGIEANAHLHNGTPEGYISLPNGYGLDYPDNKTGGMQQTGPRVNMLTDQNERDELTGIPYHKYVACKLEKIQSTEPEEIKEQSSKEPVAEPQGV